MSKKHDEVNQHQNRLQQNISDGGGCAETWEAMSEIRDDSNSSVDTEENGRRSFLAHVSFLATGTLATGAGLFSDDAAAAEQPDPQVEKTPIHGRERASVLRAAYWSDDLWDVSYQLGGRPRVHEVFEYDSEERSGYGVTFGDPETEGTTITYYEPEDGDPMVKGGTTIGDGFRGVTSDPLVATDVGTSLVESVASEVPDSAVDEIDASGSLNREQSLLVRDTEKFDIMVPVVIAGELVGRVVMSAHGDPTSVTTEELTMSMDTDEDGPSTQGHVVCGPAGWVCTNYCTVLCGALSAVGAAGCAAKCSATVAGIPIAPGCATVCAGVVMGVCYPTCKNAAH